MIPHFFDINLQQNEPDYRQTGEENRYETPRQSASAIAEYQHFLYKYTDNFMKKITFLTTLLMMICATVCHAQGCKINGTVLDNATNEPMGFASVALLQHDSTMVTSAMADGEGRFSLQAKAGNYVLKATFLGYKDYVSTLQVADSEMNIDIKMEEDAAVLQEVVVKSQLPKTQIKGDAVVTSIAGSVLEHSGNALDVLAKVPGMISMNGDLQVLGRGKPEYYINGHKVTDDSELRNLMSEDIKSVDVVSNPGALYGGDVRCVVRIKTIKRQGEGFSYALTSQAKKYTTCKDFDPSWTVLDLNYRTGGWDFIGKIVYWDQHGYQISDIYGGTTTKKDGQMLTQIQDGTLRVKQHQGGMQYQFGTNWQINNNQSVGMKVEYGKNNFCNNTLIMDNDFVENGTVTDHVTSIGVAKSPKNYEWKGNIYYDGTFNKLNINFNADFQKGEAISEKTSNETSWVAPATVKTASDGHQSMGAAKLVLSHPLWKGKLTAGSEGIYADMGEQYSITKTDMPSADGHIIESTIAGFAEYAVGLPFGQISAGLRYEHVDFRYSDRIDASNSLERRLDDWFPSASFATKLGPVALALSYTGKTHRPRLDQLSVETAYDNRYTYQSGDPKLLSEKERTLSLNANWKWLTLSSTYERVDHGITQWGTPYGDGGVVMIRYSNIDSPYRKFSTYLTAAPQIGIWYPRYTVGYSKPNLKLHVPSATEATGEAVIKCNKPMFYLQTNNAFRFKKEWVMEINYQYISKMSDQIANLTKPMHELDMSVQKSFLKDNALTFTLSWNDILNKSIYHINTNFGMAFIQQSNDRRNPGVVLRVSYRFNSAQSKYKGTGAGQSVKDRM